MQRDEDFLAVDHLDAAGLVPEPQVDAFGAEPTGDQPGGVFVLAWQQARAHFDLRDATSEPREGLGQLAADRPTAEDDHPIGALAQRPDVFRSQVIDLFEARYQRYERATARRDHDTARRQHLLASVVVRYLHLPGRGNARPAEQDVYAQGGVALDGIVRLDVADHALYALHDFSELEIRRGRPDAELA